MSPSSCLPQDLRMHVVGGGRGEIQVDPTSLHSYMPVATWMGGQRITAVYPARCPYIGPLDREAIPLPWPSVAHVMTRTYRATHERERGGDKEASKPQQLHRHACLGAGRCCVLHTEGASGNPPLRVCAAWIPARQRLADLVTDPVRVTPGYIIRR